MQINTPVYNAIDANREMFLKKQNGTSNKTVLKNSVQTDRAEYYNGKKAEKKEKNKKRNKILTTTFAVFTGASIIGAVLYEGIRKKNIPDMTKKIKDLKDNTLIKKMGIATVNVFNIKDDLWTRFTAFLKSKKIGILSKADDKLKGFYNRIAITPKDRSAYEKALKEVQKYQGNTTIENLPKSFDSLVNGLDDDITTSIRGGTRISQNLVNWKNLVKHPIDETKKVWNKLSGEILADAKIRDTAIEYQSPIAIKGECDSKELQKAVENLNQEHQKLMQDLIPRYRDTNLGNASTDALTAAISVGGLATAVATADTKEKKKSTVINLGIPLVTTLLSSTYALMRKKSGFAAILFGLGTGFAGTVGAKTVDKVFTKDKKQNLELQA